MTSENRAEGSRRILASPRRRSTRARPSPVRVVRSRSRARRGARARQSRARLARPGEPAARVRRSPRGPRSDRRRPRVLPRRHASFAICFSSSSRTAISPSRSPDSICSTSFDLHLAVVARDLERPARSRRSPRAPPARPRITCGTAGSGCCASATARTRAIAACRRRSTSCGSFTGELFESDPISCAVSSRRACVVDPQALRAPWQERCRDASPKPGWRSRATRRCDPAGGGTVGTARPRSDALRDAERRPRLSGRELVGAAARGRIVKPRARPPERHELEPIERASIDELRALQLERLRGTLAHAYDTRAALS